MAQPTNATLLAEIRSNHTEVTTRLKAVEQQVAKTNGRVFRLEEDKIARDAVSTDREKQMNLTINSKNTKVNWVKDGAVQKLFLALAGLASAAALYLSVLAQGSN